MGGSIANFDQQFTEIVPSQKADESVWGSFESVHNVFLVF
jgi:hypothetical protein